jgi:malonyl-CoA O-methyltransferase
MRGVFVAGTDTGVGKTVLCAALMAAAPSRVAYWKPVQTGAGLDDDDTATVRRLAGLERGRWVEPAFRLATPASPHHAAEAEGKEIAISDLVAAARRRDRPERSWVVEGVGGLLVPLSRSALLPGLVRALELQVLVASSTRLGTINHTLLTLRELERWDLPVLGVVLIGPDDPSARTGIGSHAAVPILAHVPRLEPLSAQKVSAEGERLIQARMIQEALA